MCLYRYGISKIVKNVNSISDQCHADVDFTEFRIIAGHKNRLEFNATTVIPILSLFLFMDFSQSLRWQARHEVVEISVKIKTTWYYFLPTRSELL